YSHTALTPVTPHPPNTPNGEHDSPDYHRPRLTSPSPPLGSRYAGSPRDGVYSENPHRYSAGSVAERSIHNGTGCGAENRLQTPLKAAFLRTGNPHAALHAVLGTPGIPASPSSRHGCRIPDYCAEVRHR